MNRVEHDLINNLIHVLIRFEGIIRKTPGNNQLASMSRNLADQLIKNRKHLEKAMDLASREADAVRSSARK